VSVLQAYQLLGARAPHTRGLPEVQLLLRAAHRCADRTPRMLTKQAHTAFVRLAGLLAVLSCLYVDLMAATDPNQAQITWLLCRARCGCLLPVLLHVCLDSSLMDGLYSLMGTLPLTGCLCCPNHMHAVNTSLSGDSRRAFTGPPAALDQPQGKPNRHLTKCPTAI
jgi:hypothetical protein